MGHCKDCRHWDTEVFSWEMGYGHCRGLEDGEPYKPLPLAYTVGISAQGASAKLMTAPDFGCVQWEARADAR